MRLFLLLALPALLAACGAPPVRELHGGGVGNVRHWNGEEFSLRASAYRGLFELQQGGTVMVSFRHGRAELAGRPIAAGCHLLPAEIGARLLVSARDVDIRFPAELCPDPPPPGLDELGGDDAQGQP